MIALLLATASFAQADYMSPDYADCMASFDDTMTIFLDAAVFYEDDTPDVEEIEDDEDYTPISMLADDKDCQVPDDFKWDSVKATATKKANKPNKYKCEYECKAKTDTECLDGWTEKPGRSCPKDMELIHEGTKTVKGNNQAEADAACKSECDFTPDIGVTQDDDKYEAAAGACEKDTAVAYPDDYEEDWTLVDALY